MQGGAIELAAQMRTLMNQYENPDLIMATDMVNVAALQGLLYREIRSGILRAPFVLYMHENQLTYPWRPGEKPDLTYAMINWSSQLCADKVAFNSRYHLQSWFDELPNLLKHYPDYNHLELVEQVREKSLVMHVGIDCDRIVICDSQKSTVSPNRSVRQPEQGALPLILWNQRWEYDKCPAQFFELLYRLQNADVAFQLAVAGQNFRNVPQEFEEARKRLSDRIVHWGYVDSYAAYAALLQRADLVVSTAIHEFFGISILEAILAGAFPLLPNRLSYPELIPGDLHPACLYDTPDDLFEKAQQRLLSPRSAPPSLSQHIRDRFDWKTVATAYDEQVENMVLDHPCFRR